jgi:hypothetical protein
MPDLSHRNPYVYADLLELVRWLVEEVGFDGFRFDLVKGYGTWTIAAVQEYRYVRGDRWNGGWVSTRWGNVAFKPVAWWSGRDLARPDDQWAAADGRARFWAPPRGYAVYAPQV